MTSAHDTSPAIPSGDAADDGEIRVADRGLRLVPLTADLLRALLATDADAIADLGGFTAPGWPDAIPGDREHVELWLARTTEMPGQVAWMARAIVDAHGVMVGHAGFHVPPAPLEQALDDPSFTGRIEPAAGHAVELGYTVFPDHRRRGIAAATVHALVEWAFASGQVAVVLATVDPVNAASLGVLARVGGFVRIGECADGEIRELVFRRDR